MNVEKIKILLKKYRKEDIKFNDPHFTERIIVRDGNNEEVISNLITPVKLVHAEKEDKNKYRLYFKISNTRTMILPVIFYKKCLYILTYIMRYRNWRQIVR